MAEAKKTKRIVGCLNCNFKCLSDEEGDFLSHATIHRFEKNLKLPCFRCPQISNKFERHRRHVNSHNNEDKIEELTKDTNTPCKSDVIWSCQHCDTVIEIKSEENLKDFKKVTTHIYKHSRKEEVACPIDCDPICDKSYKVKELGQLHFC